MRTGHLFAGIDGLGLGLEPHGFQPAWFSEYEQAPSKVLAHHYPDVPNHGDITSVDWSKVEPVDVLTGGFPCQDLSYAGKGAGIKEGTRSGLWFEYVRAIRALRPRLVVVENVAALLTRGLDIVLADLHESGFDAEWTTLRASDVGAAHRRQRLFIVATANADVPRLEGREPTSGYVLPAGSSQDATDSGGHGLVRSPQPHVRTDQPGLQTSRRRHPVGLHPAATDTAKRDEPVQPASVDDGRPLVGTVARAGVRDRRRDVTSGIPELGRGAGVAWGEFGPAIERWERVIGRPAPAPAVDGRLSPAFVEWHMGFPAGWTDILSRNERLKALGNAVVPQCADVIGRWALQLVDREQAA
jgi:DNA (cytosine-5)-methyltransferase 1